MEKLRTKVEETILTLNKEMGNIAKRMDWHSERGYAGDYDREQKRFHLLNECMGIMIEIKGMITPNKDNIKSEQAMREEFGLTNTTYLI